MGMSHPRVIIYSSYDPVSVDLAEARLEAANITSWRVGRGSAALLGAGNSIVEQSVEVEAEHVGAARQLLAGTPDAASPDPVDAAEAGPLLPSARKQRLVAGGVSLIWPGLGAVYVGFPLAGFTLAALSCLAFVTSSVRDPLGGLLFFQVLPRAVDFVATQLWLRRFGRDGASAPGQLLAVLVAIGIPACAYQLASAALNDWVAQLTADAAAKAAEAEEALGE